MGIYVRPDASDWIVDKDARTGLIDRQTGRLIWHRTIADRYCR
jgi:hypothetical protein